MMVDLKFDTLYIQVSLHREPSKVGLVKSYLEVCIGGWSWVFHPYIESATTLSDELKQLFLCGMPLCPLMQAYDIPPTPSKKSYIKF